VQSRLAQAILIDNLDEVRVSGAAAAWRPVIDARSRELIRRQIPPQEWPQHSHWEWERKAEYISGLLAFQILGIECDGKMQGLMLVAVEGHACRIKAQRGKPLVYVHYLATAPWNDPDFAAEPKYGGVGKIFLAAAIQLSSDNGFKGRVGLHSLPQADAFYSGCGMTDLGPDSSPGMQNLRYFEMTPRQARKFCEKGRV
jgi:hypothetical protein